MATDISQLFKRGPAKPEQITNIGYGKANLSETFASYVAWKVTAPFDKESAANSGHRIPGSYHAEPVGTTDHRGALITQRVKHEDGTVILLQASWKRGGSPIRDGALFLRLRTGAASYRIRAKVPQDATTICGPLFTVFEGHADILNESELTVLNLKVPRSYTDRFMQLDEIDECFQIEEFAPATVDKPQLTAVATSEGVKMVELAAMPSRRLRVGRRATPT